MANPNKYDGDPAREMATKFVKFILGALTLFLLFVMMLAGAALWKLVF